MAARRSVRPRPRSLRGGRARPSPTSRRCSCTGSARPNASWRHRRAAAVRAGRRPTTSGSAIIERDRTLAARASCTPASASGIDRWRRRWRSSTPASARRPASTRSLGELTVTDMAEPLRRRPPGGTPRPARGDRRRRSRRTDRVRDVHPLCHPDRDRRRATCSAVGSIAWHAPVPLGAARAARSCRPGRDLLRPDRSARSAMPGRPIYVASTAAVLVAVLRNLDIPGVAAHRPRRGVQPRGDHRQRRLHAGRPGRARVDRRARARATRTASSLPIRPSAR